MATTLLHRRGSTYETENIIGGPGELFFDLEQNKIYIHDGILRGGHQILVNNNQFYTKAEVDAAITGIDLTNYYTKSEVDTALDNIDLSLYYTSLEIDNTLTVLRSNLAPTGHIIPSLDITYDLGSVTNRFRDLYLSGNTMYLGGASLSAVGAYLNLPADSRVNGAQIPPTDLNVIPENFELNVNAEGPEENIPWLWTWDEGALAFSRINTVNEFQQNVKLYADSTYTLNNFAQIELHSGLTQTHRINLKWIKSAGSDNNVSWVTDQGTVSHSNPAINGGAVTQVNRQLITVPSFPIVAPTLNPPQVSYDVTFTTNYFFDVAADGLIPNLGPWYRGGTYTFNMNAAGHPLYLTTDNGTNFSSGNYFGEYTDGVTGSRTDVGTVTITVPVDAPDTLFYQCGNHAGMRGAITIKDLAVDTNSAGNLIIYAQHMQEGMFTPIELRAMPSLTTQMCIVYDEATSRFIPQDLITYIERTPRFADKIREIAGTATLTIAEGTPVVSTVTVIQDASYLPYTGNSIGDLAYDKTANAIYVWEGTSWEAASVTNLNIPYDIGFYVNGPMVDTEVVGGFLATREMILPIGAGQSLAKRVGLLTSAVNLSILVNDVEIGTITFTGGSADGVINVTSETTILRSELVTLRNNSAQTVANHNMIITLVGTSLVEVI